MSRLEPYKKYSIDILKNNKWFIIFLVFYGCYNLTYSVLIDFESKVFLPFRYEGLLYFKNAMMSDSNAFFFIRDWSTSFLPKEHPLLYIHNPDLFHFFAGFIQYFFPYPKIVLFVLALLMSVAALCLIWFRLKAIYGYLFTSVFLALIILPYKAFFISPQNLFVSASLLSIVWNFTLLRKIWCGEPINRGFLIEFIIAFTLVALVETNLNLLLCIITALFSIASTKRMFQRASIVRNAVIILVSGVPAILFRAIQFISIYYYGYLQQYIDDVKFTSMQKVQSNINLEDAIKFYADRGINFFGQGEPQTILSNLKELTSLYTHQYSLYLWSFLILFYILIVIASKVNGLRNLLTDRFSTKVDVETTDNISFLCAYVLFFIIATYALIFFSGEVLFEIAMFPHAFSDYSVVFRAIFIILIPYIIYINRNEDSAVTDDFRAYILSAISLTLFIYLSYPSFAESKKDDFLYKNALKLVPLHVDVITNFEPSIVAVETGSRVSMSWFEQQPDSCQRKNSKRLLKMYKVRRLNSEEENRDLYIFLVFYYPYSSPDKDALEKRHCITKDKFDVVYMDDKCALYKLRQNYLKESL